LAGGTDTETNHKQAFLHSGMGSKLIVLDPELCLTTPEYHWLSTGIRSMDHCVEALCSLEATAKSDEKAERGLRLLVPNLIKCKNSPDDVEARGQCQLAVVLAMDNVRAGIPMGGSHAIGHQLGPLGVPHGITSCLMCPAVMKYNLKYGTDPEIPRRQELVKSILWSEPEIEKAFVAAELNRDSADLGDLLDCVIRAVGMPRTLTELNIQQEQISGLAERALHDQWSPTNPIPLVRKEQVAEILRAVL
jgi:alcohol dehydrogenase class IV